MAIETYEVRELEPVVVRATAQELWQLSFVKSGGDMHHFYFPPTTPDIRATEYERNVDDEFDSLLEQIALEVMLPEIQNDDRDPGFAEGYKTPISEVMTAGTLGTAETIKDAREAQELRMGWMRDRRAVMDFGPARKNGIHNKLWRNCKMGEDDRRIVREQTRAGRFERRGRSDGKPLKG